MACQLHVFNTIYAARYTLPQSPQTCETNRRIERTSVRRNIGLRNLVERNVVTFIPNHGHKLGHRALPVERNVITLVTDTFTSMLHNARHAS